MNYYVINWNEYFHWFAFIPVPELHRLMKQGIEREEERESVLLFSSLIKS